ncbi:pyrimidine-nucleoside phosphorylase [Virgibacillus sp. YIM 98842]|uniref:pyrimidine-nucleoside phosphorylase n=1 Tax=Virgibacillus sp. YIM 98842 TaxID=2663533 RepID=UPI0013DB7A13|nr:pyrimidine-nucleoside phosphorylase [Virgibacillus sp. YIM 98842]
MRMYDIIEKKRDGYTLSEEEINFFVNGYTKNEIPDYQISALLMAIYFQNMTAEESASLTSAMVESGEKIDLSAIQGIKVDKHSTGGVGDTTTLILAPLVASAGVPVAKMSGRGLGHTGGTIDKLEAVPGFHTEITNDDFIKLVNNNKVAVVGQSGNLTPADKKLYSLRDVTATVNSIPLIASSIMSKKIASGADAIVLDVKKGAGAFMKEENDARILAETMVSIGNKVGRKTMAVISDMSQPLGNAIGNALEVREAINTLKGNGPKDLTELCLTLGSQMVVLANKAKTMDEAKSRLRENLENGKAINKFKQFLASQGGDSTVADHPELLPQSAYKLDLPAKTTGKVAAMEADDIGSAAMMLGAGRATKDTQIDLSVGIVLHKKIGDDVNEGEPLLTIYSNDKSVEEVKDKLYKSISISYQHVKVPELIYDTILNQ